MSNICLLLTKMIGGRKGPSGFTLSGTITGDEVEGATITLTGDASDSTTSAADGTYSFAGLSNGDYNVEPTLEGYIFDPTDIDVTIADADDVDNDFVSSGVYTISGTIVDGAAAGIEGVTVALTGDATDSTTTAADGTYSFTGVVDGSYTVTPTLANLKMTPASRAAVVSGDNVAVDNIVGQYLLLPYIYNTSDVAPSSGGIAAQLSDWDVLSGFTDGSISSDIQDANSYTPPGVTKSFSMPWNGDRVLLYHTAPYVIDPSLTSIRFAMLVRDDTSSSRCPLMGIYDTLTSTNSSLVVSIFSTSPIDVTANARYESGTATTEMNKVSPAESYDFGRYAWVRAEWNWVTDKVTVSAVRREDSAAIFTVQVDMSAAGQTLGHIPSNIDTIYTGAFESGSSAIVVKYWIGTASDDWPV